MSWSSRVLLLIGWLMFVPGPVVMKPVIGSPFMTAAAADQLAAAASRAVPGTWSRRLTWFRAETFRTGNRKV
jgi:hypothetical protein